jgi:hypothetical protein
MPTARIAGANDERLVHLFAGIWMIPTMLYMDHHTLACEKDLSTVSIILLFISQG